MNQPKNISQSVGFEPTLPEGNWFLVSRLNHSATTAHVIENIAPIRDNELAFDIYQPG